MSDSSNERPEVYDSDEMSQAAAEFLGRVLDLEEEPTALADDLSLIKRDVNASIFTIQLESTVGPAAFLVYTYVLDQTGGDGHTGRELYDAGLETLQLAAERDTPGPRALAHAESGAFAFVLATTPGTYRTLAGEQEPPGVEPTPADMIATEEVEKTRSEQAEELLKVLKQANEHATAWLQAVQTASGGQGASGEFIAFTPEETELALFLLDNESIGNLLQSLNVLVSTAQQQATSAMEDTEPE